MKRRITLSIALLVSIVLVSLIKSDSIVNAQQTQKYVRDSGIVPLGAGQILRVTVSGQSGDDAIVVRFRQLKYMQTGCNVGICKHAISEQTISPIISLAPNESTSLDSLMDNIDSATRVVVVSNNRNTKINFIVIDGVTGAVVAATDGHNGAPGNVDEGA